MNNMKKTLFAAALAVAALCSCTKEGTEIFEGYYSYKLSGEITLTQIVDETDTVTVPEVLTLSLTPESGQMNILTRDKDGGKMVITLNAMGGDATTFEASVEDGKLVIPASDKYFSSELLKFKLSISGEGSKLSDMVLMDLTAAETEISYLGRNYTLTDSKITCVATSNDR